MRRIIVLIALICSIAASPCFGQGFLKKALEKVEKGVNKVNESLESTQRSLQSKPSPQSTDAKPTASAESKTPNVIKPYVSNQTKTIYLNKGKMSINYDYNHFTDFSDGVAFVKDADRKLWATIDTDGNYLIKFLFNFDSWKDLKYPFPHYDNGVCLVRSIEYASGVKYSTPTALVIDKQGKTIKEIPSISSYVNFKDGVARVRQVFKDVERSTSIREESYYKYRFINTQGEFIYPHLDINVYPAVTKRGAPDVAEMRGISDGLRAYWSYKSGWGYIDQTGTVIIEPAYRMAHDFREGLAAVQNYEEQWGFINTQGEVVIPFIFSHEPTDFVDGLAIVTKRDNNRCYIDMTGNVVLDKLNNDAIIALQPFFNNTTLALCNNMGNYGAGAGYLIITRNFEVVGKAPINTVNGEIVAFKDGIYYLSTQLAMTDSYEIMHYSDGTEFGIRPVDLSKYLNYPEISPSMCYIAPDGHIKIIFREQQF
mgnify:CR=1 FL=1